MKIVSNDDRSLTVVAGEIKSLYFQRRLAWQTTRSSSRRAFLRLYIVSHNNFNGRIMSLLPGRSSSSWWLPVEMSVPQQYFWVWSDQEGKNRKIVKWKCLVTHSVRALQYRRDFDWSGEIYGLNYSCGKMLVDDARYRFVQRGVRLGGWV